MTGRFYIYCLFRPWDGSPCYVGKGCKDRVDVHAKYGRKHPNRHLARIFERAGGPIPAVIIHAGLTEAVALEYEVTLIAAIGRRLVGGPLVNGTDGGEGTLGHEAKPRTQEHCEKIRQSKLGKPRDAATRAKLSAANKGKKPSSETVAKMSASHKRSEKIARHITDLANKARGVPLPPEHREKLRLANLGKPFTDERRKNISDAQRGKKRGPMSPEALERRRLNMKVIEWTAEKREVARQNAIRQHARRREAVMAGAA